MNTVNFLGTECNVVFDSYAHGGATAIRLVETETGAPFCHVTINPISVGVEFAPHFVLIKNYSENSGVMEALQEAGIIGESLQIVQVGFTKAHICRLLVESDHG